MYQITQHKKIFWSIPLILIVIGLISYFAGGFVQDPDFADCTQIFADMGKEVELSEVSALVQEKASVSAEVTTVKDHQIKITTSPLEPQVISQVKQALTEKYELTQDAFVKTSVLSAKVGWELKKQIAQTVLIVTILILLIYISVKFAFSAAIGAIVAVLHDCAILLTAYTVFRMPVGMEFLAVLLLLTGLSVTGSIILFRRIRANRSQNKAEPFLTVVDNSILQNLGFTVRALIITLAVAVIISIFGTTAVRAFSLPLIICLIAGAYSSIFVTGPVWALLAQEGGAEEETVKN